MLGLHQNITILTHVLGNTLDLIFSEANNKIKVEECTWGDYISDHCLITCILGIDKPITTRKEIKYCKVKSVNVLNMASDIRKGFMDSSTKSTSLEDRVIQFESILKSSLDEPCPSQNQVNAIAETNSLVYRRGENIKVNHAKKGKNLEEI